MSAAAQPARLASSRSNPEQANAPRLALRRDEAARSLGISEETFDRYVRPRLQVVRLGTVRLYPIAELEAFLAAEATSIARELAA